MRYRFYTCDVFTNSRFGGNPLAVLPNATGLTDEQMQLIAREFNYSETTFVFPPKMGGTREVRIFTRIYELPFAGHPNVGTAFILATTSELGSFEAETNIVFEEKAGLVPITIRQTADLPIWCELKAPQTLALGQTISPDLMAEALSLSPNDIVTDSHLPQVASVGVPFLITEVKDRGVLGKIKPNHEAAEKINALGIRPSLHVYTQSGDEFDIRARMFAPLGGGFEDPATGSANCALVGLLAQLRPEANGRFSYRIAQGVEMGRPSVLDGRSEKQDGTVTGVWMAGSSVLISEGYIHV